jgi:hypothetical protein
MTNAHSKLPAANVTGPCQLQASFLCTGEGIERLNPTDMLSPASSFRQYVTCCQECYDHQADAYVATVHR